MFSTPTSRFQTVQVVTGLTWDQMGIQREGVKTWRHAPGYQENLKIPVSSFIINIHPFKIQHHEGVRVSVQIYNPPGVVGFCHVG